MEVNREQMDNEILSRFEERLSGLRDGTAMPVAYWDELSQAWERFSTVIEDKDSPQWQSAFAELDRLIERGPTEEQKNAEIQRLEKMIERRFNRLASNIQNV